MLSQTLGDSCDQGWLIRTSLEAGAWACLLGLAERLRSHPHQVSFSNFWSCRDRLGAKISCSRLLVQQTSRAAEVLVQPNISCSQVLSHSLPELFYQPHPNCSSSPRKASQHLFKPPHYFRRTREATSRGLEKVPETWTKTVPEKSGKLFSRTGVQPALRKTFQLPGLTLLQPRMTD